MPRSTSTALLLSLLSFLILSGCAHVKKNAGLIPRNTKSYFKGHKIESVCPGKPSKQLWRTNTAILNPPVPGTATACEEKFGKALKRTSTEVKAKYDFGEPDKIIELRYPNWTARYLNGEVLISFDSYAKGVLVSDEVRIGSKKEHVYNTLGDKNNNKGLYVRNDALRYCFVNENPFCELQVSEGDCLILSFKDDRVSNLHWERDVY